MFCGEKPWGVADGAAGTLSPSNLGSGAAGTCVSVHSLYSIQATPTSVGQLRRGIAASLVVSDESQNLAEARHGQQAAVLCVCNLPYLAQHGRGQLGALEELDGDLARYDAKLLCVGLLEEVLEYPLLIGCEVQGRLVCVVLAVVVAVSACRLHALSSPLPVRSAMAARCERCQVVQLVDENGRLR